MNWWPVLGGAAVTLLTVWLVLIAALWVLRPDAASARTALRLLPDLLRMLKRLAADPALPRGVRLRLWLVLGYLAVPIDLVPDVLPVIGYADDVIVLGLVLRSVVRRAGAEALERHWPGDPAGLDVVRRLAGL